MGLWALFSVGCARVLEKLPEGRQGGPYEVRLLNQCHYLLELWDNAKMTPTEASTPSGIRRFTSGDCALDAGFHRHMLLAGSLLWRLEYLLS